MRLNCGTMISSKNINKNTLHYAMLSQQLSSSNASSMFGDTFLMSTIKFS